MMSFFSLPPVYLLSIDDIIRQVKTLNNIVTDVLKAWNSIHPLQTKGCD